MRLFAIVNHSIFAILYEVLAQRKIVLFTVNNRYYATTTTVSFDLVGTVCPWLLPRAVPVIGHRTVLDKGFIRLWNRFHRIPYIRAGIWHLENFSYHLYHWETHIRVENIFTAGRLVTPKYHSLMAESCTLEVTFSVQLGNLSTQYDEPTVLVPQ